MADDRTNIEQSSLRTLIAEILPKIVDAAMKWTPDKIKELLSGSPGFLKLVTPLFSEGTGIALVESLKKLLGDSKLAGKAIDAMDDIRAAFLAQYGRRLRENTAPTLKGQPGMVETIFPPARAIIDPLDAGQYHHPECHALKRTKTVPGKHGGKDRPNEPDTEVPRTDLRTMRIEQVLQTPCCAASCCAGLFAADIDTMVTRAAEIAKNAPKSKAEKSATSFLAFIGRAQTGKITGADPKKIPALLDLFDQLTAAEIVGLDQVDNDDEFVALFSARNISEFRRMIVAAKDRRIHGHLAEIFDVPAEVVRVGVQVVATLTKEGEKIVKALPGNAKALDARVTASAESFAKNQKRLLEIERYARKHKLKDVKPFKAWILGRNIVDLENNLDVSEMQRRFGVRS